MCDFLRPAQGSSHSGKPPRSLEEAAGEEDTEELEVVGRIMQPSYLLSPCPWALKPWGSEKQSSFVNRAITYISSALSQRFN